MGKERIPLIQEDEITIKEIILDIHRWVRYIWSKKWVLLLAFLIGGLVGFWYAFSKAPVYTATTTFVLESNDPRSGLGRLAGVAAVAGLNFGGDAGGLFQGKNIFELYKSRRMLAQALLAKVYPDSNELLIERYIAYNKIKEEWKKDRPALLALDFRQDPTTLDPANRRRYEGVITSFVRSIRSEVLTVDKYAEDLSIVQVNVTSPDEVFSKVFNETLVKKVNEFYIQTKTKKYTDNISILEKKVDSVYSIMTGAIYSAAQISDATPNLNPTRQVQRVAPAQEAQFSAEANKAILTQLQQNLEIAKMTLLQEQPLIQIVDQPVYPLQKVEVGWITGMVVGAFVFGFLTVLWLVLHKTYRNLMAT